MTAINTISKHTDKLWVVGVVAGAICGVTKGLYDRKKITIRLVVLQKVCLKQST